MITVFIIDTSPSMGKHLVDSNSNSNSSPDSNGNGNSMSRLDLAKMAVEEVVRRLKKRVYEHNSNLQQFSPKIQESFHNIGLGFSQKDELLLLTTAPQHASQPSTAICGAGGRLLVGFGVDHYANTTTTLGSVENSNNVNNSNPLIDQPVTSSSLQHNQHGIDSFQRELKRLKVTDWVPSGNHNQHHKKQKEESSSKKFPEDGGGIVGLNAALSAGLQMLSRYRLKFKCTENFGMGRLPSTAILNPSMGGTATTALQPACMIIITDGTCLRSPASAGGGALKLQSSTLLRDFYQEPFRWDQRIFCLGVGGKESTTSTQFLHPHLRALCEVTGGSHMMLRPSLANGSLSHLSDMLVNLIAPQRPRDLPILDPLSFLPGHQQQQQQNSSIVTNGVHGTFLNGGPVVCFQALEPDMKSSKPATKYRAVIAYVPMSLCDTLSSTTVTGAPFEDTSIFQPPVWCIPESFFPSKKLDTLPPRPAQPNLLFSRFPSRLGSKCFEPSTVMKTLARLDQLVSMNLKFNGSSGQQSRFLKRDVYICEWISVEGKGAEGPISSQTMEYFPVLVSGAGRPTLSDGEGNFLSIGILHVPPRTSITTTSSSSTSRLSTLTLLPPEPHVLLPLLIRAIEAEHRVLKRAMLLAESKDSVSAGLIHKQKSVASRSVHLDESWRNEFRAYLFRLPPYYQIALKRSLRGILPSSAHSLLNTDGSEGALSSQCFSKICLQKIRNAEQISKVSNERLEHQEAELRRRGIPSRPDQIQQLHLSSRGNTTVESPKNVLPTIKYGQYDPRCPVESYLAALRQMPAPWRVASTAGSGVTTNSNAKDEGTGAKEKIGKQNAMDVIGDLPGNCLMAYYESRRRWIFGGSGVSIRGLHIDGVNNDGSNVHHCGFKIDKSKESLLSYAGVGVSELNATTTAKMGDFRERLLWSRAPVVGYGANDSIGVAATTSQNGAPVWSVDNDAMPIAFFDERTGEFVDSVQARLRSRLVVNFGNPYKDKRADSLIPEAYLNQRPRKGIEENGDGGPTTPPTSPPHDAFAATEGEGEAVFAGKPISRGGSRKSTMKSKDIQDEKTHAKRQKLSPEKLAEGNTVGMTNVKRGSPLPRNKFDKLKDERTSQPPPPPPPRQFLDRQQPRPPPPPQQQPSKPIVRVKPRPPPPPPRPPVSTRPPPPPSKPVQINKQRTSVVQLASQSSSLDLQTPDTKPDVNLPPGWICSWSKSQNRWYFFNTKNNKSVWQWPPP
mmetsp:Transcript_51088/g.57090  ORF Transcript_51088/g.57090 Transcript_51088/m.57090 type:complete len:1234 (-) Transcript_51088:907-4608(-)